MSDIKRLAALVLNIMKPMGTSKKSTTWSHSLQWPRCKVVSDMKHGCKSSRPHRRWIKSTYPIYSSITCKIVYHKHQRKVRCAL